MYVRMIVLRINTLWALEQPVWIVALYKINLLLLLFITYQGNQSLRTTEKYLIYQSQKDTRNETCHWRDKLFKIKFEHLIIA